MTTVDILVAAALAAGAAFIAWLSDDTAEAAMSDYLAVLAT